jgi:Ca2+:H+ antiporter
MLLVGMPLGVTLHTLRGPPLFILVLNFLAFIPLAALFSYALEELALRVGEVIGGLFNVTFGFVIFGLSSISY